MGEEIVQTHEITLISPKMMLLHDNEFPSVTAQKNRSVGPSLRHLVITSFNLTMFLGTGGSSSLHWNAFLQLASLLLAPTSNLFGHPLQVCLCKSAYPNLRLVRALQGYTVASKWQGILAVTFPQISTEKRSVLSAKSYMILVFNIPRYLIACKHSAKSSHSKRWIQNSSSWLQRL